MRLASLASVLLLILATPAEARRHGHCQKGQIYRVSLGTCQAKGRVAVAHVAVAHVHFRRHGRGRKTEQPEPVDETPDPIDAVQGEAKPVRATKEDRCGVIVQQPSYEFSMLPWPDRSVMASKPAVEWRIR